MTATQNFNFDKFKNSEDLTKGIEFMYMLHDIIDKKQKKFN